MMRDSIVSRSQDFALRYRNDYDELCPGGGGGQSLGGSDYSERVKFESSTLAAP